MHLMIRYRLMNDACAVDDEAQPAFVGIEVFVDGSSAVGGAGARFVCRKENSKVVATGLKGFGTRLHPTLVEAYALKLGVQCALEAGFESIHVSSDCSSNICYLLGKGVVAPNVKSLLDDVLNMGLCFDVCKWRFVPRAQDVGAHILANLARGGPNEI